VERDLLERYLAEGLSLERIGVLVNRDPATVGYWMKKHGLVANGRHKHASRGGLSREQLERLVARGMTLRQMSAELGMSASTVRHWMKKFGLRTRRHRENRHLGSERKPSVIVDECRRHGETEFVLENRGAYRCKRCRSQSVSQWRQRLKRRLIDEAGGACAICGYSRHPSALHFHHLDPTDKEFALSHEGVTRSLERARIEARKCVLLCANCHAEVEAGVASLS
jgi:DNA-binding CsgD family transcriptional regulator